MDRRNGSIDPRAPQAVEPPTAGPRRRRRREPVPGVASSSAATSRRCRSRRFAASWNAWMPGWPSRSTDVAAIWTASWTARHAELCTRIARRITKLGLGSAWLKCRTRSGANAARSTCSRGTDRRRSLLVIEVKSRLGSVEATLRKLDEKARLAPGDSDDGSAVGTVRTTSRVLVLPANGADRRLVAEHRPVDPRVVAAWERRRASVGHVNRREMRSSPGSAVPGAPFASRLGSDWAWYARQTCRCFLSDSDQGGIKYAFDGHVRRRGVGGRAAKREQQDEEARSSQAACSAPLRLLSDREFDDSLIGRSSPGGTPAGRTCPWRDRSVEAGRPARRAGRGRWSAAPGPAAHGPAAACCGHATARWHSLTVQRSARSNTTRFASEPTRRVGSGSPRRPPSMARHGPSDSARIARTRPRRPESTVSSTRPRVVSSEVMPGHGLTERPLHVDGPGRRVVARDGIDGAVLEGREERDGVLRAAQRWVGARCSG